MRYNKRNFKKFINQNINSKYKNTISFQAYCEDLKKQHNETGTRCYEMNSYETKSSNPELFYY